MIQHMRVGIPVISRNVWQEGFEYIRSVVKGVSLLPLTKRPKLFLVATVANIDEVDEWLTLIELWDGVFFIGGKVEEITKRTTTQVMYCHSYDDLFNRIDFYFPAIVDSCTDKCVATWIPEINHRVTADFFLFQNITYRNEKLAQLAEQARIIVFSSSSVEKYFSKLYPSCKALTTYLPLRIYPDEQWYTENPQAVSQRYGLPNYFVLCCNNFELHKNYPTLFKAIAILRQGGKDMHVVCAVSKKMVEQDDYFKVLKQYIQTLGIEDLVHIVSGISYQEKIQLIRCSLLVIQPSLMEELGIIIDLCQAMGKPIISSDIDIHQQKTYGNYFAGTDASQLAEIIADLLPVSKVEPDFLCENEAKMRARAMNEKMAEDFCRLVDQSQFIINRHCYKTYENNCSDARTIIIATSLAASKDLNNQRLAVNSWKNLGFSVVSINSPEEIALLQPHFSDISFVQAYRDARSEFNKPYIYFDDFLAYFAEHGTGVCGIVNSDIHLLDDKLYSFVKREAINSLVYGSRINVNTLDNLQGEDEPWGFDYFFFDRNLTSYYPKSQFCIGMSMWDYWALLIPLFYRIPVKRVMKARVYHIKHQETWKNFVDLCANKFLEYITPVANQGWPINFREFICRFSREVSLDTQDMKPVVGVNQNINRIIGDAEDSRIINGVRFMVGKDRGSYDGIKKFLE